MATYPNVFGRPLTTPAPAPAKIRPQNKDDWIRTYNDELKIIKQHNWPIPKCHCGRNSHLVGTSSVIPIFPLWQKDKLCIFHCPERHINILENSAGEFQGYSRVL